jgi:hypothetical protein
MDHEASAQFEKSRTMSTTRPVAPIVLEPAAQAAVDASADSPCIFEIGPTAGRKALDDAQSGEVEKPDVGIEDTVVPGGPAGEVSIRILRPRSAIGQMPVILYAHLQAGCSATPSPTIG